jgi:hypothetical protein
LDTLLERLKKYKYDTDDTYKNVAMVCGIPFSTFYNFSGGTRPLKEKYQIKLDAFLKEQGY